MTNLLVIVTNIWQRLSCVEHKMILIVIYYWQLLSEIIGETSLIVRNYWRNRDWAETIDVLQKED